MKCPFCNHEETKVTDKRDDSSEGTTRRRRECLKCGNRFTTYERPEILLTIVKKDNSREDYSRDKLKQGIVKACEKRPVSREKIEKIIGLIERKLRKKGNEVQSKIIGKEVMKMLKKTDKIAYIRFASVYKDFKDIKDFKKTLKELK